MMNTTNSTLEPLGQDLWHVESTVRLGPGIVFPSRMTVVKLPSGGLWLHSPVALSDEVVAQLEELGPVEHLVAPNLFHHMFMAAAQERFPDARTWCAPGLREKISKLSFDEVLTDEAPAAWSDTIDQRVLHGTGFMEVVFLARPSATIVFTDLFFNMSGELPTWATKILVKMVGAYGRPAQSRLAKSMIKDRPIAGAALQAALDTWDFDAALVAHGDPITRDARAQVETATAWMRGA